MPQNQLCWRHCHLLHVKILVQLPNVGRLSISSWKTIQSSSMTRRAAAKSGSWNTMQGLLQNAVTNAGKWTVNLKTADIIHPRCDTITSSSSWCVNISWCMGFVKDLPTQRSPLSKPLNWISNTIINHVRRRRQLAARFFSKFISIVPLWTVSTFNVQPNTGLWSTGLKFRELIYIL